MESRVISISCPQADESDVGDKDEDRGKLKNLTPSLITSFSFIFSRITCHCFLSLNSS